MAEYSNIDMIILHKELKISTARSGGSGGQHVNKVETKVILKFDIAASKVLDDDQKELLLLNLKSSINKKGELVMSHETARSQAKNKVLLIQKFDGRIEMALRVKKKRKPTKIPAVVNAKRLNNKKIKSVVKSMRKKPERE